MTMEQFFIQHPKAALAFSGGVDSAYLLAEALRLGADVQPYFIKTVFQPAFELHDAQRLTRELGVPLTVVAADILAVPDVAANPPDRCYHCKRTLFSTLAARAAADGYPVVLDGTNASDKADDRPGMRALAELGVLSPLRLCGLDKAAIRARSRALGLFTADKPAYACLATRIPAGRTITAGLTARVEAAEAALFGLGFSDFRVRVIGGFGDGEAAGVQLPSGQMAAAVAARGEIEAALRPHFTAAWLALRSRDEG